MMGLRPQVGVGLLIVRGNEVLLGKRKGSHGEGLYASTGGHMEYDESIENCVKRELVEEAGPDIRIKNLGFLCLTNFRDHLPKHYIDIGMLAEYVSGRPVVMEPEKKESWDWFDMDDLPSPLFGVVPNYVEAYKTGKNFFDD